MPKEFIKSVQRRLSALALYDGAIDGLPGGKTEKGIDALFASYKAHQPIPQPAAPATSLGKLVPLLPAEWLPKVKMKRIHAHWTGGSYTPSSLDKEHYHVIFDGSGKPHRGIHSIADNVVTSGKTSDHYAAHTLNANSGAIGVSVACMGGLDVRETPFNAGKFPMTEAQWDAMCIGIAQMALFYDIPVTDTTVLSHAEVHKNLGIAQRGKWDFTRLAFAPSVVGAKACGDKMRFDVLVKMAKM